MFRIALNGEKIHQKFVWKILLLRTHWFCKGGTPLAAAEIKHFLNGLKLMREILQQILPFYFESLANVQ